MFGVINVLKPTGWTSRDVVNRVTRLARPHRAGHAGTLDPIASGVLLVCVGQAVRLVEYMHLLPKSYLAEFRLGCTSPTDDTEVEPTELDCPPIPERADIEAAAARFVGEIEQLPPQFSAVKVAGQRAYKAARKGTTVEIPPRQVTIHRLAIREYDYPRLQLEVDCGSGTYIRSLGRDLAASLGTGAVMTGLVRTAVGVHRVEAAASVGDLAEHGLLPWLQPARTCVASLPQATIDAAAAVRLRNGLDIVVPSAAGELAVMDEAGELVAIVASQDNGRALPLKVFGVVQHPPRSQRKVE